jgi:hypothetical protein
MFGKNHNIKKRQAALVVCELVELRKPRGSSKPLSIVSWSCGGVKRA